MTPETAEERIAKLERRLHDGFLRIGEAMQRGVEVENWERHFVMLVREFEALSDELAAAPLAQVSMPGMPRREAA